jgi:D-arginine dehydrogenase
VSQTPQHCDVVVIGAGMAGASVAAFLATHVKVAVVEREALAGMHTTGRSAAMFMESYGPAQVRALTRASRHYLEQGPGWLSPRSALFIARASQEPALAALEAQLRADANGAALPRRQSSAQALQQVPALRPEAAACALLDASAADIDVHSLHQHFLGCVRALGSTIHLGVGIHSVRRDGAHWQLEADDGRCWQAPVVVNAAGAWVDTVAALAGVAPIGIQPRRRSAFTFAPPAGTDVRTWPAVVGVDEDFYFKPDAGVLLGSPANADPAPPHDVVAEELDIATGIARIEEATTMSIRRPLRTWAGLRSFVASGQLVGAFDATAPGFFWCCGQGGYGIQTAPAMGQACAARVLGRPLPSALADQGLTFAQLDRVA